jgi:hypothetical protein
MPLSHRSRLSLAQLLYLVPSASVLVALLPKHGLYWDSDTYNKLERLIHVVGAEEDADKTLAVVEELLRTAGDVRAHLGDGDGPGRWDLRLDDLARCVRLDGYEIHPPTGGNNFWSYSLKPTEPTVPGAAAVEDDLTSALKACGLPEASKVQTLLDQSASAFTSQPPDYNACLTNARVALQTLATAIAKLRAGGATPLPFQEDKWAQVLSYLRTSSLLTEQEEKGVGGVFSFTSPGAHTYVSVTEQETTRLGRSLAVSMIYFLLKKQFG